MYDSIIKYPWKNIDVFWPFKHILHVRAKSSDTSLFVPLIPNSNLRDDVTIGPLQHEPISARKSHNVKSAS